MSIYDPLPPKTLDELFMRHTREQNGCRIWTGSIHQQSGMPRMNHKEWDGYVSPRQYVYLKTGHKLYRKRRLYNTCKNNLCVEPTHLTYQQPIECPTLCFGSPMATTE